MQRGGSKEYGSSSANEEIDLVKSGRVEVHVECDVSQVYKVGLPGKTRSNRVLVVHTQLLTTVKGKSAEAYRETTLE